MKHENVAEIFPSAASRSQDALTHPSTTPTALVKSNSGDVFELASGDHCFQAHLAFSCLVHPEAGDKVSYLHDDQGIAYITHVLHRDSRNMSMKIPGNLDIQADHGQLTFAASERLNMISGQSCSLAAKKLHAMAEEGNFSITRARASGESLDSTIKEISIIANSVSTVADLLMQRVRNSVRSVEVLDKVDAGEMISSVKKLFSLRAKQTMVTAEQDVKIDGDRVHIG